MEKEKVQGGRQMRKRKVPIVPVRLTIEQADRLETVSKDVGMTRAAIIKYGLNKRLDHFQKLAAQKRINVDRVCSFCRTIMVVDGKIRKCPRPECTYQERSP
jgi:hypothetical protein